MLFILEMNPQIRQERSSMHSISSAVFSSITPEMVVIAATANLFLLAGGFFIAVDARRCSLSIREFGVTITALILGFLSTGAALVRAAYTF
jgi:hypothetical protein